MLLNFVDQDQRRTATPRRPPQKGTDRLASFRASALNRLARVINNGDTLANFAREFDKLACLSVP